MSDKIEKYSRLVSEAIASLNGDLIEFSGMNCDDCEGWNGADNRCECGNRRVYWELNDDGESVSAVAY